MGERITCLCPNGLLMFFVSFIQPLQSIMNGEVVPFVNRNVSHDNLPFLQVRE